MRVSGDRESGRAALDGFSRWPQVLVERVARLGSLNYHPVSIDDWLAPVEHSRWAKGSADWAKCPYGHERGCST